MTAPQRDAQPRHAKSAANPDWPYEHRCVECGEDWPCAAFKADAEAQAEQDALAGAGESQRQAAAEDYARWEAERDDDN